MLFLHFNRHFCGFYANSAFIMPILQVSILCPFTTLTTLMTFTTFFYFYYYNIRNIRAFPPYPAPGCQPLPSPSEAENHPIMGKIDHFSQEMSLFSPFQVQRLPSPAEMGNHSVLYTAGNMVYRKTVHIKWLIPYPGRAAACTVLKSRQNAPILRCFAECVSIPGKYQNVIQPAFHANIRAPHIICPAPDPVPRPAACVIRA